jgi:Uma2 family endonuclease
MSTQPKAFLSPEQYLEIERRAEFKSEYYAGEMFAMSGGTGNHAWIIGNLVREIGTQLKGGPCRVCPTELRVRVSSTGLYTYPDVIVVCGDPEYADARRDTLLNPTLLIEVLSDSTRDYDRGRKFQHYRALPSVAEYLTVEQTEPHVEHYVRQPENRWLLTEFADPGQTVQLASIGCALPLSEIYDKIDWTAASVGERPSR